jgi:predicted nucleic acid-binding protein
MGASGEIRGMIILDTDVASALMRPARDARLVAWLDQRPSESLWLTAVTVFELRYGVEALPDGRRRDGLDRAVARALSDDFAGRVLPLDEAAAAIAASLAVSRKRQGRPIEIRDTLIAGIVLSRRAELATRNIRHFQDLDVPVIDPFAA